MDKSCFTMLPYWHSPIADYSVVIAFNVFCIVEIFVEALDILFNLCELCEL